MLMMYLPELLVEKTSINLVRQAWMLNAVCFLNNISWKVEVKCSCLSANSALCLAWLHGESEIIHRFAIKIWRTFLGFRSKTEDKGCVVRSLCSDCIWLERDVLPCLWHELMSWRKHGDANNLKVLNFLFSCVFVWGCHIALSF